MPSTDPRRTLLGELLRGVSRSFYLTLRVLPGAIRDQIGTAYLLARATDTIADTDALPVDLRLAALRDLSRHIAGSGTQPLAAPDFASIQSSADERLLLQRIQEVLQLLNSFDDTDRELIRRVLQIITSGQELDLVRFGNASSEKPICLQSAGELHDYTYRVAGCVGEFWTRMCLRHLKPKPSASPEELIEQGIRFGKGLQLVNILRDLPRDLRNGRCYLPETELHQAQLKPADLLIPANEPALRPVYNSWLNAADAHFAAGWTYVLSLPRSWLRLRLACAWPILIGLQTVDRLKRENILDPAHRIKISRAEVKRIMRRSMLALPFPSKWERLPAITASPTSAR